MRFVLVLLLAIVLISCDNSRVYEVNHDFNELTWKITETPEFEFIIKDLGKRYNIYYNVRNSLDYPYARLFVNYSLRDSTGVELSKKMVSEFLFDQKTGQPLGSSGLGDVYDHRFPLLKEFEFKQQGKYKITLEQFMRMDTLSGILAVGARVEVAESVK
jgi:gliding motility-associated lipoprotein GldH